jgi:hypothetical protein
MEAIWPRFGTRQRVGAADGPQAYWEYRLCLLCYPVNQWVMRKDIPGEPSMRYGKLLTG